MMILKIAAALLLISQCSLSIPLDQFYPFGISEGDQELSSNDFVAARFVFFSGGFSFYNRSISFLYVSTNGIITLQFASSLFQASPQPFPVFNFPYIAPYWFGTGSNRNEFNSTVYYREAVNDIGLITRVTREVRRAFPDVKEFYPTSILIVTWELNVNDSSDSSGMMMDDDDDDDDDDGDAFQCVLVSDGSLSFVIFYYADGLFDQISALEDGSGFEGSSFLNVSNITVQAGLNAADSRFQSIETENIYNSSNVDIPGVWMYQSNERFLIQPNSSIFVEVTTTDTPVIEQPLVLQCSAITVRGITDRVDILWTTGTMAVRKVIDVLPNDFNSLAIYNDSFVIPSLDINDIGVVYQCEVIVNSFSVVTFKDTFTIPLPVCPCSNDTVLDVVFVIDESGSIGASRFQLIREFVRDISTELISRSPRSAVGVILFNGIARIQFNLRAHTSLFSLLSAIDQLPYNGGSTDTAEALRLLLSSAQNGTLGLRNSSSNVAIVITDGFSNSRTATLSAAAALHASNVFDIYAIGVDGADLTELRAIASNPEFVFFTSSFTSFGLQQLQEGILQELCFQGQPSPTISLQPNGFSQNTVGQMQDVICSISVTSDIDLDSVELAWFNEEDIVTMDGRVSIVDSANDSANFSSDNTSVITTIIQFNPLFQNDEGNYACYSIVNGSVKFESIQLQNFSIPTPFVQITVFNNETFGSGMLDNETLENETVSDLTIGDPLTLDCSVIAVRGISSSVDIIWTTGGRVVRRVNDSIADIGNDSVIYTDSFEISSLSAIDNGRVYQCTAVINASPQVFSSDRIILNFDAPVCFNTTGCDGDAIGNNSLSFFQCCFLFSGISYASSEQCLLCPTTDCTVDGVKDIVFVIDTSSSIGFFRFQMVREFVDNVSRNLLLNSPESSVGVILFDNFAHIQFTLGTHSSLTTLSPAINPGLPYGRGFRTDTAGALRLLLSTARNGFLGIRNKTSNIAIVITDGRSDNRFSTQLAAAALHAANIFDVYAIGYGSADSSELNTIASDPNFVYFTNFFNQFDVQNLQMNVTSQLCSLPVPRILFQPSGFLQGVVGEMQDIICSVTISSTLDSDSVELTWTSNGSTIMTDNRVTIVPTNIIDNPFSFTYTTTIQFAYLMEGDEGSYTCNVVVDEMMESHSVTLQNLRVPRPLVQVTSIDALEFGDVTTLECSAIAVRGITSRVDIIWMTGFRTVRRVEGITATIMNNSAIYTDQLVTPPLSVNDNGRVYQCQLVINADFRINAFGSIVLDFIVPSCYISTSCIGEPINKSISFAECCTNFGVSFDLDGRCQPCPTTNCSGGVVRDVVFVIDTNRNIGFSRFQIIRELTENVTTSLKVYSPESLVGVITFDFFARLQFNISRHTDLATLLPAINPGLPYNRGFSTDTGRALDFLLSGGRQGGFLRLRNETSNIAIVITDRISRSFSFLQSAASSLHAANIFDVYAVGIGGHSFSDLRLIASDPSLVFSTSFLNSFTAQQLVESITEELCSTPAPRIFLRPNDLQGIVGEMHELICVVALSSTLDTTTVQLQWNFISNDNRITVLPATVTAEDSIGNIYSTVIQFAYLVEEDEGNYTCTLTVEDPVMSNFDLEILNPIIDIQVTTISIPTIDQPLILQCSATIVRGITSRVDIIWSIDSRQVRRVNNVTASSFTTSAVYNDSFIIPSLNISDIGDAYQCEVLINSILPTRSGANFTIPIPGNDGCSFNSIQDLVFVIDESGSIGASRFQLIREFVRDISTELISRSPRSAVGVILFDGIARIQFNLRAHTSLFSLLSAINRLPYNGGSTDTAEALQLLLSSARNRALGLRRSSSNVAIVITDGFSNSRTATLSAAAALHASNLFDVYAVGVGGADLTELRAIASSPEFVFFTSSFTSFSLQQLQQRIIAEFCISSILNISLQPSGFSQNTVGQRQEVICSIFIPINVDPDTITLAWLNEEDIVTTDGRVTIDESSGNSSAGNLSVTIQFDPLFEDDENNYTCYAIINGSFVFESIELQSRIPIPFVQITVFNNETFGSGLLDNETLENETVSDLTIGDPLTLDCTVTAVRGISSSVDIAWTTGGIVVRRVNDVLADIGNESAIYTDSFEISSLSAIDNGRVYQCTAVINANPQAVVATGQFILNFPAPTCFNSTYCDGESFGNDSMSFDQCCFEFLGVSFASPGQCMLCPKTACTIDVVKDIVFVIDTSWSIGSFQFQMVREFVDNVTINLKLNSPESSVGIILFDNFARIQFTLGTHSSLTTLSPAINPGLLYGRGFGTDTAGALRLLLSTARNGFLGIRNETSNIAIVITDGRSDNRFSTQLAAAALHAANIFDVYAIGYGSADINELYTIASDPHFIYFANFFNQFDIQRLQMNLTDQLCSLSVPRISMQPSGFFSGIIGEMQDIICSVTITSTVDPSSVELTWINGSTIATLDNRVTIFPTNITANLHSFTYTTTIRFAYLTEADQGSYICSVIVNEMTESRTTTLQNLRIPRPVVQVTSIDAVEFGDVTTLECSAVAVRGITSRVDIIWTTGFRTVRRVEGITGNIVNSSAIYTDQLVTSPLSVSDNGRVYRCQVVINADFRINAFDSIVLDFIVPSCYSTTNCNGGLINSSITFADCCSNFGASYDLDGRCQSCPTTNCSGGVVRDVVFIIDTNRYIGFSRFQTVRELTENIITSLKVNSPESSVGVITFDSFAQLQFNISRHTDLATLLPAINPGLPYNRGFSSNTGRALDFLLSGGRQGGFLKLRNETSNIAIVITGGISSFSFLRSTALSLHAANIFDVYAVGIGGHSFSDLRLIASDPSLVFSTSFLSSFTVQQLLEDIIEELCLMPTPNIFLRPNGSEIGEPVDLVCSVALSSTVDPSTVELMWNFISNDNRVVVMPATITTDDSIGSIYSTVIQFSYLMEGDEGNYTCNLTIQDSAQSNFELELTAPPAIVEISAEDDVAFGEPVTLQCNATVVRGVTSNLNFQWFVTSNESVFFRRSVRTVTDVIGSPIGNSIIYNDYLVLSALNVSDRGDIYTCEVRISNSTVSFSSISSGSFELDFPVPSCYVITNCNGYPIGNVSTTFSECCTSLSGVSFELERQCRMCPTSGCPFKPRNVVLVLDNSFAVRSFEFPLVREFAESVSISLKIGSPNSSVGVILFDSFARVAIDLEEHSTVETLVPAINPGLPYSGISFRPNTADALRLLLSISQSNATGLTNNTSSNSNIAILFTADRSRNSFDTRNAAAQLHAADIYDVYAVGIDRYDSFELSIIASDPSLVFSGSRFFFSSFRVQQLARLVIDQLCSVPPPFVTINAPDEQDVGQTLTLECQIEAVKDIDGTADIIWTTGNTEVRRVENIPACLLSNYSDFFTTPVLSRSDNNREYQCEVIIKISPSIRGNGSIRLNVTQPPQMIISPSQSPHRITVGTQQLLYCAAEGLPTPTVQWMSNGVPLHPLQQPYQQLYLVPTDSPHTTVYTCIGKNHIRGVDRVAQADITVIVERLCPALKPPFNGQLITSNDGEFAFFSCNRGFDIRGPNVLQCIDGKWNRRRPYCQLIPFFCRWRCGF